MAMNNYILQKIIHAYQNGGADLGVPFYFDMEKYNKNVSPKDRTDELKSLSKQIQQSSKFFVDMTGEQLTNDEIMNCLSDIPIYLPYPVTFVQFKYSWDNQIQYVNSLFTDIESSLEVTTILSDVSGNAMTWEVNRYRHFDFKMFNDKDKFEVKTEVVGLASDCISDESSAKDMSINVLKWYLKFLVMLNYPEITVADDVMGRPNNTFGHVPVKNMKRSTLIKKPKYQHKTLVLDMFGDKSGGESCSGGRSKGTAFHSVRKHLRQYKNGKKVFVKAHFRGSKEVGMIFKDYKIDTE